MNKNVFPSKILLAGEYTVIHGGSALAIPYANYSGSWRNIGCDEESETNQEIDNFLNHLTMKETDLLNLKKLTSDYHHGYRFCSTIPQGYGLGSSGALVASLYEHYAQEKKTGLIELKKDLALLENFFHGQSSGLDPLVSYLNTPLKIDGLTKFNTLTLDSIDFKILSSFYLLDSTIARTTSPLIKVFTQKCQDVSFLNDALPKLLENVNQLISSFLNEKMIDLNLVMENISQLQFEHFKEMIPADIHQIWMHGLETKKYFMKLCGAGGGGYFLVYLPEFNSEIIATLKLKSLV